MDRFPSGHEIQPFCLLRLTRVASEESKKAEQEGLKTAGNC